MATETAQDLIMHEMGEDNMKKDERKIQKERDGRTSLDQCSTYFYRPVCSVLTCPFSRGAIFWRVFLARTI